MPMITEAGTYRAKLLDKQLCEAKTGTSQIALSFEVVEGPHAGEHITDFASLTDKALKYTIEKLRATGWRGVDLTQLESAGSAECYIVVQSEEYQGQQRLRVRFVNALDRAGPAMPGSMDAAKQKALAAKLRGAIAGLDVSQVKASAKPQPAPSRSDSNEPPPPGDEDLPF